MLKLICISNLVIVFPTYVSKLTITCNIGWILTVIKTIIHIWLRLPLVTKVINQQQATNHKVDMSHIDESSVDFSIALLYYQYRSFCIVFHGSPENHMGPFNMVLYGMGSTFDSQTKCQIIPGNDLTAIFIKFWRSQRIL